MSCDMGQYLGNAVLSEDAHQQPLREEFGLEAGPEFIWTPFIYTNNYCLFMGPTGSIEALHEAGLSFMRRSLMR
jgi:hypothetical protein